MRWGVCALTALRGWNGSCSGLRDGDGFFRTWMSNVVQWCICVAQRGRQERSFLSAAAHVAALDGDGLGHMHTKQRAEGLRLRGAHAGHSSGLDPISAGY